MKLKSEMLLEDLRAAHAYMAKLRETLEAVERELEGVRKVEAWMKGNAHTNYVAWDEEGFVAIAAMQFAPNEKATADSLAALGHLLPEVPDAK